MADNTVINSGSGGDIIATDEISGVKHQRVKVQYGSDGSATDCSVANPLPVNVGYSDSPAIDAFGRLRQSYPQTILDVKQLYDKQPLFFDESITNTSGNATSTHSTSNAATTMYVEANDTIIRQTKIRCNYQPGKSQLILVTGVMGSGVANVRKRIGYFDQNNGLFFELDGTTLRVVERKNGSDIKVDQANWNVDKLDGTGNSGITIDVSKAQIFVIDFEWLGVGRVRYGFVVDGIVYYCHYSNHANSNTSVYMATPNNPIRYEISSTGGTGSLMHICSTVISEGGIDPIGISRSHSTGSTHIDANVVDTVYATLGIRLKSTHLGATVLPTELFMISETNDDFRWILSFNPTVSGTFTYSDLDANSCCQIATGTTANTVSSLGTVIKQGYASTETRSAFSSEIINALKLGSLIDGTSDELVLSVMPLSAAADIQASMNWQEVF